MFSAKLSVFLKKNRINQICQRPLFQVKGKGLLRVVRMISPTKETKKIS